MIWTYKLFMLKCAYRGMYNMSLGVVQGPPGKVILHFREWIGALLEEEMATHSSILAWRIPWTEKPGRLQSRGLQRVGHDWAHMPGALWQGREKGCPPGMTQHLYQGFKLYSLMKWNSWNASLIFNFTPSMSICHLYIYHSWKNV